MGFGVDDEYIEKVYACLSYYFHIPEPELLSDEELFTKWKRLEWIRAEEKRQTDA